MSIQTAVVPTNKLLDALPTEEHKRFLRDCVRVDLLLGTVLYEQGQRMPYVYFPTSGFVSMLTTVDDHFTLEVGMVGNEGVCGSACTLGSKVAAFRALVQGSGSAWRIETDTFLRHLRNMPALRQLLERYLSVVLRQLAQSSGCLRFHIVEKRLARWLLMTHDRALVDSFKVTQEFLAYMLGVRRAGVSEAAHVLQSRKLIRYSRGNMTILNRGRLEAAACECYRRDLKTYEQGLAGPHKRRSR